MSDPQRVADLVHVGVQVQPLQRHVDDRRASDAVRVHGVGEGAGSLLQVVERDLGAARLLDEIHADDVAPLLQRLQRNRSPAGGDRGQVDGDGAALGDVEAVGVAAKEPMGQLVRELVQRADWRRHIIADGKPVGTGAGIAGHRRGGRPRRDVYVIGSGAWGGEDQPRTAPSAAVVILTEDRAAGAADVNVRILQRKDVHRDGDLLARRQLDAIPIMVPDYFELIVDCRADGDCHARR